MPVQVRERARGLSEYCHTAEQWQYVPFTVDHIVPLAQGGTTILENLALALLSLQSPKIDPDNSPRPPERFSCPTIQPSTACLECALRLVCRWSPTLGFDPYWAGHDYGAGAQPGACGRDSGYRYCRRAPPSRRGPTGAGAS
jgi:hypothetical protein